MKESKERFDSAGVKLIAVGVGAPEKARILAERVRSYILGLFFFLDEIFLAEYRLKNGRRSQKQRKVRKMRSLKRVKL